MKTVHSAELRCALYARYSTEMQRQASIEDQFRVCEQIASREGFDIVERFSDREISGGTAARPGYLAMLDAARRGEFEVILVEDISRLWRSRAEFGPRSAELEDLGVHMVTAVGDDTRRDSWGLVVQIKQAMAEHQRREVSYRTKRGLEGLARDGKPTGGRAYGYRASCVANDPKKKIRVIEPHEAKRVVWMFERYAEGWTRERLARQLNADCIPTPSAAYPKAGKRTHVVRWTSGAVTYILSNPLYKGMLVWKRTQWTPSARDSSKRRVERVDEASWITSRDESLRLVSDELWEKVQHRMRTATTPEFREAVRAGQRRVGHESAYLLGGIIRCASCGRNYVGTGIYDFICSGHDGTCQGCPNDLRFRRDEVHEAVVSLLREHWLSDESIERGLAYVRTKLREQQLEDDAAAQPAAEAAALRRLDEEARALRSLKLRPEALAAGLAAIEVERAALKARSRESRSARENRAEQLMQRLPAIVAAYRRKVMQASAILAKREYVDDGREAIRSLLMDGHITLAPNRDHTAATGEVRFKELGAHVLEVTGWPRRRREKAEGESRTCSWAIPRPDLTEAQAFRSRFSGS